MSDKTYFQKYYIKNRDKKLNYAKRWQQENREKRKEYMLEYRKKNPEKWESTQEKKDRKNAARRKRYAEDKEYRERQKQDVKDYIKRNPEIRLNQRLKKYGIDSNKYREILALQGGGCAICGSVDSGCSRKSRLHVDHCHKTGNIRGLLCTNCNHGIGKFKDSAERLIQAANYIKRSSD